MHILCYSSTQSGNVLIMFCYLFKDVCFRLFTLWSGQSYDMVQGMNLHLNKRVKVTRRNLNKLWMVTIMIKANRNKQTFL